MDTLVSDRQLIEQIFNDYTQIPYSDSDVILETVFDRQQDRYLVMVLGREPVYGRPYRATRRVHGCLIHVDIIDGKFWIQRDGTEEGVASDLLKAGIPPEPIVLGFLSQELRQYSQFAIT